MGTQDNIEVYKVYRLTRVNTGKQDITGYTRYIGVYRVYSITKVNMGAQGI